MLNMRWNLNVKLRQIESRCIEIIYNTNPKNKKPGLPILIRDKVSIKKSLLPEIKQDI